MQAPRLRLLGAALVAAAALPAPALAAPDWVEPRTVPGSGVASNATSVAVDADGRATYGTFDIRGIAPFDTASRLLSQLPGEPLDEQLVRTPLPGELPAEASVAAAADGTAVACLGTFVGPDPLNAGVRYDVTYRPAGSRTWEPPALLAASTVRSSYVNACEPVVGPDGTAAVVTRRVTVDASPRRSQVMLAVRRPGGAWSTHAVSGAGTSGLTHAVGVDAAGNVTVLWDEQYAGTATEATADDRSRAFVATRAASNGVLGVPQPLTPAGGRNVAVPQLAVGADGTAVAAFQHDGGAADEHHAWAAVRPGSAAAWGPTQQLVSDAAASSAPLAVGVAPDGTAYVGSGRQAVSSGDSGAVLQRLRPGAGWSGETGVGASWMMPSGGGIAFVGEDAVFGLSGTVGGGGREPGVAVTQAVRWRAGSSAPDGARDLLPPGTRASLETVTTDHQGGVFALLDRGDLGSPYGTTQAVAYDASAPRLAALDVPSSAVAGAPVAVAARFADLWSPLGATTWSFGDGSTATGETASHAWAAPGSYTVTARGVDVLGNERAATAQIAVAPAPDRGGPGPAPRDVAAPRVALSAPRCARRRSRRACAALRARRGAWRTLRGTVSDAGGSGVARVEVAVARRAGRRLLVLRGSRFRRGTSATFAATTTPARVRGGTWSLRLPRLARGTYLLRIRALDGAGNASAVVRRTLRLR